MSENHRIQSLEQVVAQVQSSKPEVKIGLSVLCVKRILDAGEEGEKYRAVMVPQYEKVSAYVRSQSRVHNVVASVACRGAMLLEKIDDVIDFAGIFIQTGDIESIFSVLEYLKIRGMGDRAQGLIEGFFNAGNHFSDIGVDDFARLARYAYFCGCDEIGYELACRSEEEDIGEDDPRILKYRQVVRNPEEFEMAISETINYFRGGVAYISNELLGSLQNYIEKQIAYLDENDAIEPKMLTYYEAKLAGDTDGYDFHDKEGKYYIFLSFCTLLAVLFQDANRAGFLLKTLLDDTKFDNVAHIVGDVVYDLELGDFEEDPEKESLENDIKDGLLTPLMKMYAGIEYADDIHAPIYKLFQRMYGSGVRGWIESFQMRVMLTGGRFGEVALFYLAIIDTVNRESSPITAMHLQMQALQNENGGSCQVGSYSELAQYALWFYLYHGKFPIIAAETIQNLSTIPDSDICINFLKQTYCYSELDTISLEFQK